ncbi:NAD(P)/FAD-dependent oxidoreductase [bacterium SCSIO 12741]|nr:NAD(P)/FAD-dependent oxidoreductase [bacterium SCSIO 12741]
MSDHLDYDAIIIGSGLGGLLCASTFCDEGLSVLVLEKNNQLGGNLQIFKRDGVTFDTGVHYLGGLGEGQNLHRLFEYHGILSDLKLDPMDPEGFDIISFDDDPQDYKWAQGYERFIETLSSQFPGEQEAIKKYCAKIQEFCLRFPLYNLKEGELSMEGDLLSLNAQDFIDSLTSNPTLRAVLAGNNLLYAGNPKKTPFYVHALVCNSYILSAYRCVNGGGQIAQALAKKIRRKGGKLLRYRQVDQILSDGKKALGVTTTKGETFTAKHIISNLHPAMTFDLVEKGIRKATRQRMKALENGISAFSVHLVMKPESFPYLNHNRYHFKSANAWSAADYTQEDWPRSYMLSVPAEGDDREYAHGLSILTYMRSEEMAPWKDSFNTIAATANRGEDYEQFKSQKAEKVLLELEKRYPGIQQSVQSIYTSSPLSYRDYIGTPEGSMYGIEKDSRNPLSTMISGKTKLENLYLTGQNLNLHGILGVSVSAFKTCSEIFGLPYLLNKIN